MSNPFFNFKQFTIRHDKCAMKVGTDGVLLGTWTNVALPDKQKDENQKFHVLDIGTGTGLIALMIAQRNKSADIDAIEVDQNACNQAIDNIKNSPFRDKVHIIHKSFVEYSTEKKYDLIVSNPPFFQNALKCPDEKRSTARHNDSLPLKQLIEHAIPMLSENGRIALILPAQLSEELDFIIATHKLYTIRRTDVIPVEGAQPKRFLIEISGKPPQKQEVKTEIFTLETKSRKRTEQYQKLTKDFYL